MNPEALPLNQAQRASAEAVLAEEAAQREHLVVALSGAHAYGFPSPDSDVDLKAVHVEPTRRLVGLAGLSGRGPAAGRIIVTGGVEIDYSSNEIGQVLRGILAGDGNFLERVLCPLAAFTGDDHAALRPLVQRSMSRKIHRHYSGFAAAQLKEAGRTPGAVSVKKLLYVVRTALTGTHALLHGEIRTDIGELAPAHGFADTSELVALKRSGEAALLGAADAPHWTARARAALDLLDATVTRSVLPEEPPNAAEIEDWLVALRKARW